MKLALNIGSLAVIGLLSFSAFGQPVRTAPRPTIELPPEGLKPGTALTVRPGAAAKPTLESQYLKSQGLTSVTPTPNANQDPKNAKCGTLADTAGFVLGNTSAAQDAMDVIGQADCDASNYQEQPKRVLVKTGKCIKDNGGMRLNPDSAEYQQIAGVCLAAAQGDGTRNGPIQVSQAALNTPISTEISAAVRQLVARKTADGQGGCGHLRHGVN